LRFLVTDFNPDRSGDSNPGRSPLEQPTSVFSSGSASQNQEALDRLTPTLEALPAPGSQALRMNIPLAVANCMQVATSYQRDREMFEATFKADRVGVEDSQDLADRARALWQADLNLRTSEAGTTELHDLLEEATALRQILLQAAGYLWDRDPAVRAIRTGRGHLDTTDDLAALATLFQQRWEEARGQTRVKEQDLARADELANLMIVALRRSGVERRQKLGDLRRRAASHAMAGVEAIRLAAAVVFRDQPETLEDYPSFFKRPKSSRRRGSDEEQADVASEVPTIGGPEPSSTESSARVEAAQPIDPASATDAESRAG
jgi:hypothetical protein